MINEKKVPATISRRRRIIGGVIFTIGYILSPASWWNDAVINLPLAYMIAWIFSRISPRLFLPFMIIGYWATNVVGIMMLYIGGTYLLRRGLPNKPLRLSRMLIIGTIYTIIVVLLVKFGILKNPI